MLDTQIQRDLGRAKNALQEYFINKLLIPKVYLDADWNGVRVQVLAIDRAGVGDVHAVRMIPPQGRLVEDGGAVLLGRELSSAVSEFRSLPCQFRYVAAVIDDDVTLRSQPAEQTVSQTFAEDGVGRIGVLYVDLTGDEPSVRSIIRAERFRSNTEITELADKYVASHTANWEVRE